MTALLFLHGMNGTAKNWTNIPDLLAPEVTTSQAIDLPGHDNPMSILDVLGDGTYVSGLSMEDYISAVAAQFPSGVHKDVVLVGHSMGGAVISHVAAKYPDRIAKLIYVAAMLLDNTQSAADVLDEIKSSGGINPIGFLGDFLPHISKLDVVRQPKEPMAAAFSRSSEFDEIPRAYVRCTKDDVIPLAIQNKMLAAYPGTEVVTLERSHFPQFQDPEEIARSIRGLLVS